MIVHELVTLLGFDVDESGLNKYNSLIEDIKNASKEISNIANAIQLGLFNVGEAVGEAASEFLGLSSNAGEANAITGGLAQTLNSLPAGNTEAAAEGLNRIAGEANNAATGASEYASQINRADGGTQGFAEATKQAGSELRKFSPSADKAAGATGKAKDALSRFSPSADSAAGAAKRAGLYPIRYTLLSDLT